MIPEPNFLCDLPHTEVYILRGPFIRKRRRNFSEEPHTRSSSLDPKPFKRPKWKVTSYDYARRTPRFNYVNLLEPEPNLSSDDNDTHATRLQINSSTTKIRKP